MWDSRMTPSVERIQGDPNAPRDVAIDDDGEPSVMISPHSELGKELRRWEQHPGPLGRNPGNPYVFREFPKMLYRAETHPVSGQATCMKARPNPWEFIHIPDREARAQFYDEACQQAELWNKEHQKIVRDEFEERIAKGQGWANTVAGALERFEQDQQQIAEAAAQTAFHAQRMSDKARAELAAADASTDQHVVDVRPRKKRGRPAKGTQAVTATEA